MRVFRLEYLFHILIFWVGVALLLFDIVYTLGLVHFLFVLKAVLGLRFGLTLVVPTVVLTDFVVFLAHFGLVLEPFRVPECVQTVVG